MSNFTEVHVMGAALFHADGQTDRHDKASNCIYGTEWKLLWPTNHTVYQPG